MSKKLLSLVVALAMVLTSMSFAFAATDSKSIVTGITDDTTKEAVGKLFALGMTEGLDDGQFHPEKNLTRAEATTFIIRALGLESAASAGAGVTPFSDVAANHWASGYINVAVGQGLVQGMGDGTFAPEAQVTYAQAITMLVRALGYKDSFLKGTWPGNYLAKAADEKVTKKVTFAPNGIATRGSVAILLGNTLDANMVDVTEYNADGTDKYKEVGTLLEEKLEITKIEDARLVKNELLGATEGTLKLRYDANSDGDVTDDDEFQNDYDLASSDVDTNTLIGQRVNAYLNDDEEVLFLEKSDKVSAVIYYDLVDKILDNGDVKLKASGKTFDEDGGRGVCIDAEDAVYTAGQIVKDQYGKFIVENGEIAFADVYTDWDKESILVKSVNGNKLTYYAASSGSDTELNMDSAYEGGSVVKINGATATFADIKPYDVLYIAKVDVSGDDTALIFDIRSTATGKVGGMDGTGSDDASVDVGGKSIDVGDNATFSLDMNENIDALSATASEAEDNVDEFYGADVTVYKDWNGKIRHIVGDVNTTSKAKFGVIKKVNKEGETVKIYTQDGDDVTYGFEDTDKIGYLGSTTGTHITAMSTLFNAVKGASDAAVAEDNDPAVIENDEYVFASFELTKDGKIAEDSLLLKTFAVGATGSANISDDFGTDTLEANGAVKYVDTDNVKVFDAANFIGDTSNDPDVTAWSALKEKDDPDSTGANVWGDAGEMFVITFTKDEADGDTDKDVEAIFVVAGDASDDAEAAYVVKYKTVDDDQYAVIHRYGKTETETIEVGTSAQDLKEAARVISTTSGNKVDIYAEADEEDDSFAYVAGKVYDIDGTKFYINGTAAANAYKAESDAIVYSEDEKASLSDIEIGDMIVAVVKDGKIQVVEWNKSDSDNAFVAATVQGGALDMADAADDVWASLSSVSMIFDGGSNQYLEDLSAVPNGTSVLVWKKVKENKVMSVFIP